MTEKENPQKAEFPEGDMHKDSLKDKIVGNKFLIIVTLLVISILVVAGFVSDQRLDLKDNFLWRGAVESDTKDLEAQLQDCENELQMIEECTVLKDTPADEVNDDNAMMKVESSFANYNVSFEYPKRFVNSGYEVVENGPGFDALGPKNIYTISVELTSGDTEVANPIFMVTDYKLMFSIADVPNTEIDEYGVGELNIDGKTYPVSQYIAGEGVEGRTASVSNYLVKLEDDLYISVVRTYEALETYCVAGENVEPKYCNEDPRCDLQDDCSNFEPKIFKKYEPSQQDIDDAFKIMESFTWEREGI